MRGDWKRKKGAQETRGFRQGQEARLGTSRKIRLAAEWAEADATARMPFSQLQLSVRNCVFVMLWAGAEAVVQGSDLIMKSIPLD